ncbi:hypothetical protein BJ138DRAFT_408187 [Hygrophoropsis aurantiaca]|uniref:Uncharacterized protein n=1 Tax=Hygrophoropsis aurantiaca TaxID=72124 RepID=A0ACB8A4L8_9AGAM|nr:hypothetical protein BJ138DRAFT_408187 [Hygrophoropsis aurantiaca]
MTTESSQSQLMDSNLVYHLRLRRQMLAVLMICTAAMIYTNAFIINADCAEDDEYEDEEEEGSLTEANDMDSVTAEPREETRMQSKDASTTLETQVQFHEDREMQAPDVRGVSKRRRDSDDHQADESEGNTSKYARITEWLEEIHSSKRRKISP